MLMSETKEIQEPAPHIEPALRIDNATLRYHDSDSPVFRSLSLEIAAQRWTCILGRSGCGKTSLLRMLAGLLDETAQWQGALRGPLAENLRNNIAYMAQQDLLMPWLSVLENVCFSLRFSHTGITPADRARARELLNQVGLTSHEQHLPHQLSGGMRQRVALARTLMQDKPVVLMDEPFSALDAVTRHKLQNLAASLLKGKTTILITHDPMEALRLGEQIYILHGGNRGASIIMPPAQSVPRELSGEFARLQQEIMQQLEAEHA